MTQQIRRYYEFGQLYEPQLVVLLFAGNDPEDNLNNQVTTIENGRFIFRRSDNSTNWLKRYLSNSIIQKSQIYNLFRDAGYQFFKRRVVEQATQAYQQKENTGIPPAEKFYVDLLDLFANDLAARGIKLIMIAVNDQLNDSSDIKKAVGALDASGVLRYVEVADWFENVIDVESPEGHL